MEILTNLNFLNAGQFFPPESQKPRLSRYAHNKQKFNAQSNFTNNESMHHVLRLIGNYASLVNYRFHLNFQRKIAYKTADFLFQEQPTIAATPQTKAILSQILEDNPLDSLAYAGAIDASRFGDAIYLVRIVNGKAKITLSQPSYWFPIVDSADIKQFHHHVLAWKSHRINPKTNKPIAILTYQIHSPGHYVHGEKILKGDKITTTLFEETIRTGLSDFAVIPIQNVVPSDTVFGTDDFTDINCLTEEIEIRLEQIAKILDKHADPTLAGPVQALDYDETTGEYHFRTGNYLPYDKDTPLPSYVTWDGQLDAAFKEIERLIHLLSALSEMGSAIFDHDLTNRVNISGRALRLMYINVLSKIARLRKPFDHGLKKLITLTSQVGYPHPIQIADLSIHWKDGLPNDPHEMAEIARIRLAGQPSDSVIAQIIAQDGVTEKQAQIKYNTIFPEEKKEEEILNKAANSMDS